MLDLTTLSQGIRNMARELKDGARLLHTKWVDRPTAFVSGMRPRRLVLCEALPPCLRDPHMHHALLGSGLGGLKEQLAVPSEGEFGGPDDGWRTGFRRGRSTTVATACGLPVGATCKRRSPNWEGARGGLLIWTNPKCSICRNRVYICTVHVLYASLWCREGSPWNLMSPVVPSGLEIPRHLDDDGVGAQEPRLGLLRLRDRGRSRLWKWPSVMWCRRRVEIS